MNSKYIISVGLLQPDMYVCSTSSIINENKNHCGILPRAAIETHEVAHINTSQFEDLFTVDGMNGRVLSIVGRPHLQLTKFMMFRFN